MLSDTLKTKVPLALLIGAWVFVVLALVSFDPMDWPSHAAVPPGATANWCGPVGAFLAYHGYASLGAGVWVVLSLGTVLLGLRLGGVRVPDPWLRIVGVALLAVGVAAAASHLIGQTTGGLPEGTGGVIGIATASYLADHFNAIGTRLVLFVALVIAVLLAADEIFTRGPVPALAKKLVDGRLPQIKLPTLPKFNLPKFRLPSLPKREVEAEQPEPPIRRQPKPVKKPLPTPEELLDPEPEFDDDRPEADEPEPESVDDTTDLDPFDEVPSKVRDDIVVRTAQRTAPTEPQGPKELGDYTLPAWDVLAEPEEEFAEQQEEQVRQKAADLEAALDEFGVEARVCAIDTGPVITMYELELTRGTKVSAITGLANDIARSLAAESIRIVAPIPGKHTVGIEVPNSQKEKVRLKDLMATAPEKTGKMAIPLYLGKDASGAPLITDLAAMPHCLIAGTTGSGKSVCINTIIMSILYTQRPDRVKLILVDPKVVEMAPFKDIPHLMAPVITETGKATAVLDWACNKMDERYELLAEAGVRNIASYNSMSFEDLVERFDPQTPEEEAKIPKKLPYMVIIIDELADLMMTSGKEVEGHIVRIAQKARAVGIHMVLATQRPQATVVTGLIKSNMPTKIAFRVNSKMDSRIVMDGNGAEVLLGQGDMLFLPPGASRATRGQGTFIDDNEIRLSVKEVKKLAEAQYEPDLVSIRANGNIEGGGERDELFNDAVDVVMQTKRGSVSLLQRKLTIGYSRASRLIEQMYEAGIVGEYKGSQAREPAISVEEWEQMKQQMADDEASGMSV
jgi:S-DNA-T family DNA segregation ATPase FtsK/SpoIIIE